MPPLVGPGFINDILDKFRESLELGAIQERVDDLETAVTTLQAAVADLEAAALTQIPVGGSHTVSAGDVTTTYAAINTGVTPTTIINVLIRRGAYVVTDDASIQLSGDYILVAGGASNYVLTAGDTIHWSVFTTP